MAKVGIVDDNYENCEFLKILFPDSVTNDGSSYIGNCEYYIVDYLLVGKTGLDYCKEYEIPFNKVIIMTALRDYQISVDVIRKGCLAYVEKGFTIDEFKKIINV